MSEGLLVMNCNIDIDIPVTEGQERTTIVCNDFKATFDGTTMDLGYISGTALMNGEELNVENSEILLDTFYNVRDIAGYAFSSGLLKSYEVSQVEDLCILTSKESKTPIGIVIVTESINQTGYSSGFMLLKAKANLEEKNVEYSYLVELTMGESEDMPKIENFELYYVKVDNVEYNPGSFSLEDFNPSKEEIN